MNDSNTPRGFESRGVTWARVRLARWLGRAAIGSAAAGLIGGSVGRAFEDYAAARLASGCLFVASLLLLVASFIVWFRRASCPGAVTLDGDAIDVRRGGWTRRIERSQITSAYAVTRHLRGVVVPTVEVELSGGDLVSFEVQSDEVARSIVDDLGFGRGRRCIRIALGSPGRRLYHLLIGLVAYYAGSIAAVPLFLLSPWASVLSGPLSALTMVVVYAFLRGVTRAPEVTIGDDGVFYRSGRKRRFLPGVAITGVEQPSVAFPLLIRSSGEMPIAVHGSALDLDRRAAVARLVYERFVGPMGPSDQGAAQFARGGRTLAAWRDHLRTRAPGYREAAASPTDVAAAILSSPRCTHEERIGAALALRVSGEPDARIRVAASAVADDDLRVALETIAESEDDGAIEKALRKLTRA